MTQNLTEEARFARTIAAFDRANARDPNSVVDDGSTFAKELAYAKHMTAWLDRLYPDATEALRLAARCQHIERWRIPRSDYSMDRVGYLKWRRDLKLLHAERAAEIMRTCGYDEETIRRVGDLVKKVNLKGDPDSQALEDVACLVFLQTQYADFSQKHEAAKIVTILRKTWHKMSPRGQAAALDLELAPESRRLIGEALGQTAC